MQKPAPASSSFEDLVGEIALCRENLVERGWLNPRVAADLPDRWHQKGGLSRKERTLFIRITRARQGVPPSRSVKSMVFCIHNILLFLFPDN